jgi:hypothetical protein
MRSSLNANSPFRTIRRICEAAKEIEPANIVTAPQIDPIRMGSDEFVVEQEPPNCMKELLLKVSE